MARDFVSRLGVLLAFCWHASLLATEPVKLDKVEVWAPGAETTRADGRGAVTVYGGNFLAVNGVASYQDLAPLVPGFFVSEQSVENVSLNLRGLTSDTNDPREQPQISVFQDGIVLANSHGNSVALFDLEDTAVFKGPQPTAFGRGISGGALALTSNRATNARSGALTLGFGSYHAINAELVVNQPLVAEKLFARVAVHANRREGYVKNLADGSDLQGEGTVALRTSLRWQPTTETTADLIFNYQRDDTPGVAIKSMRGVPGLPAIDTDPFTPANLNRGSDLFVARTILSLTGVVNRKLGDGWTLTATSGWRDVESNHEFDPDGTPFYLLEVGERFHARQLSQELRFAYDAGGPFTTTVGVNVAGTKDEQGIIIRADENALWMFFTRTPPPIPFNPRYAEQNAIGAETSSGDLFARGDYKLTGGFTIGGGLRVTRERLVSRFQSFPAAPRGNLIGLLPTSGGANNLFRSTTGRLEHSLEVGSWSGQLDARYALTPQLATFATVSRGRRPPVQDFDPMALTPEVHAEESLWNYEVGVKGASARHRLRYEASIFQYDFDHFQTQRVIPPGVIQPYDGGRARGRGVDATLQAEPARDVTLFATYGFTDAKFADRDENGAPQLLAGDTFRLTSRHVVTLGGTLAHAIADRGTVFLTPLFSYRSEYYFENNNAQNGGILHQGGYGLVNLRLGYRSPNGRREIVVRASNLFGKKYLLDAGNIGGAYGIPTETPAAPRRVDVTATVRF